MIIELPNTNTRRIAQALAESRDSPAASGRVLTLIVVAGPEDDLEQIISTTATVSHEHPARVLVLVEDPECGNADRCDPKIDAIVRLAGASEMVIMEVQGETARHLEHVVTPLLLPDTPIVTWWPSNAPAHPAEHPLGRIAERRITDSHRDAPMDALYVRKHHYHPGDTDLVWARITPWRGIMASAMNPAILAGLREVEVSGSAVDSSVDIAAGWLASRLEHVRISRTSTPAPHGMSLSFVAFRGDRDLVITAHDRHTLRVEAPGSSPALVAFPPRTDADCLAEELRHLDPDAAYAEALAGLDHVIFPEG